MSALTPMWISPPRQSPMAMISLNLFGFGVNTSDSKTLGTFRSSRICQSRMIAIKCQSHIKRAAFVWPGTSCQIFMRIDGIREAVGRAGACIFNTISFE